MDDSKILQPVPVTPKTPATAKQNTPPTVTEDRKFVFDVEERRGVGREERKFVFEVEERNTPTAHKEERKFVFDVEGKKMERLAVNGEKSVEMFMEEQIEAMKVS